MYYKNRGYKIFNVFNYVFLSLLAILCLIPLIHVLAVSFSGSAAAAAGFVGLWPVNFTIDAYTETLGNEKFVNSIFVSIQRTILGTVIPMLMTMLIAYPLSKSNDIIKGRAMITWFFVFTMLFSGGIIPNYILILELGLMNSMWSLILPHTISAFHIVLLLNFFRSIPKEIEEAAIMDGAGHIKTLFKIYLPLSMPAIATLSLFMMVFHWNSWFDGLIYMSSSSNYPLATFLQTVIVQQDFSQLNLSPEEMANISERTVKSAQIFIGALPILLVYPFLQKYFVKGIVLGGVKE
ncbi:carbohydrate ABC transporter permease [Gracilibacillus kekensis]|uniref:Aldotetraouronic acid ABC transporter membrane protein 1 /aldotetraouronic acid ABC transporter membrane protein 2 n=1 Tax=Gracilibacillus kekensis TaxID=1027249 RepID=A0A1M7QTK0_9BACI|nr:carbohydrate ABC transporter permease [Gracilibacillus kekensis]SHN35067.1 aldotetraouronic acid ABC transporter membrane protein 1 /aldotetraouronic acid ABC transporter membrane protein 2 [Gracilibacillus kekensis]